MGPVLGEVTMDPILARQADLPSREDIPVREQGDILARQDRPSRGDILAILVQVLATLVRLGDLRVDILDQQLLRLDILVTREQEGLLRDLEDTLVTLDPELLELLVPGVTDMEDTPHSLSQARARDIQGLTPCSHPAICLRGPGPGDSCARSGDYEQWIMEAFIVC